jgi:ATPases of the AAA+ class
MTKLEIKRDWLKRVWSRVILEPVEAERLTNFLDKTKGEHNFHMELSEWSKDLWRAVLDEAKLPANVRSAIALHIYGMKAHGSELATIYDTVVENMVEFGTTFQMIGVQAPNCELLLNGRWYPVVLTVEFVEDESKLTRNVQLGCYATIGDQSFRLQYRVTKETFQTKDFREQPRKICEILQDFGLRRLTTSASEFNLKLVKTERQSAEFGRVVLVTNSVIRLSKFSWWRGFDVHSLGSTEMPSRCIVEPDLEANEGERGLHYGASQRDAVSSRLPFVRLFCLETKSYVYADIDDICPYEFDTDSMSRLHLPNDMHSILQKVFNTPIEKMFGDLLKGKHGGVVVLASGAPGVGKTLTAEIYAETTQRPLYVLELGELGTKADDVEERLQRVFARVTRWNAVLQFDECEIFLAKRGDDLERSAIVGIFLRLLDYYRGLLFLTTNRPEVLDEAILSRVMLKLDYPHLDQETRIQIWQTMFSMAGLQLESDDFSWLAEIDLNGRQIRNITRLAKILNEDGLVTKSAMQEALRFGYAGDNAKLAAVFSSEKTIDSPDAQLN